MSRRLAATYLFLLKTDYCLLLFLVKATIDEKLSQLGDDLPRDLFDDSFGKLLDGAPCNSLNHLRRQLLQRDLACDR